MSEPYHGANFLNQGILAGCPVQMFFTWRIWKFSGTVFNDRKMRIVKVACCVIIFVSSFPVVFLIHESDHLCAVKRVLDDIFYPDVRCGKIGTLQIDDF